MFYKIDETDKKLLYYLEQNARIPDVKLARLVGKSKDSVRYRIKKLEEVGVIKGYTTWIDFVRLGYQTGKLYLTLANLPKKRQELIQELKNEKRVFWLGIAEGAWNIGITFFVKSNVEFFDLKNHLFTKYKDLIVESKTASLVSLSFHEKSFLVRKPSSITTMVYETSFYEIDDLSKNILQELYVNSRVNIATIAENYDTTVDIIRNRIKKLEKNKIITKYTIRLDYRKIGYELYKAFIYLKDFHDEVLNQILKYAEHSESIINIVKQISPWDLEFVLFVKDFDHYNEVINKFTEHFSNAVKKIETAIMSEDILFPAEKLVFE